MVTRPRRKIPATLRDAIHARDGHVCVYCQQVQHPSTCLSCQGRPGPLTLDHVVPHSHKGSDEPTNLVTACVCCNVRRATCPIDLFAAWLAREGYPGAEARVLKAIATPLPTK